MSRSSSGTLLKKLWKSRLRFGFAFVYRTGGRAYAASDGVVELELPRVGLRLPVLCLLFTLLARFIVAASDGSAACRAGVASSPPLVGGRVASGDACGFSPLVFSL